ncbi:SRPBCC family protein [Streptomyces sp. NPDC002574]|uniref:SRPBCC family protein n=1 Tax=Streptomyces sp. NPDC002574 TaxID=3364652 RepID=UPI0036808FE6
MTTFSKTQHYPAAASAVWDLIGDFYSVDWMPGVAGAVPDTGLRTRTVTMHDGGRLVERLLDEGKRFHHYCFEDPGPVPVTGFSARIAVVEDGPDRSTVEWTASFEPVPGVPAEQAAGAVGGFYRACLDRIAALLDA